MNKTRYDAQGVTFPAIKATDFAAGGDKSDVNRQRTDSDLTDEISPLRWVTAKWKSESLGIALAIPRRIRDVDATSDAIKTSL